MKKNGGIINRRIIALYIFASLFFILIIIRLFSLQIKNGQDFRAISNEKLSLSVPISAERGEIWDRYGRVLVTNKDGYFIAIEKINETEKERNSSILKLKSFLSSTNAFQLEDVEIPDERKNELLKKYNIDEEYKEEERAFLIKVRNEMERCNFSFATPFIVLENADIETVTKLKENISYFPDVTILTKSVRDYLYPKTAVHILGRVGKISSEEYENLKGNGYTRNDYIGKQGVEKAFEKYLKGTDGMRGVEAVVDGKSMNFIDGKDAIKGENVVLTIDLKLQQATEEALRNKGNGCKGAAVVVEVNSGELLASASYPSYDISTFTEDFKKLVRDPDKPMFNRAFLGQYEPGSVFKPITAIAAIDSGKLRLDEEIIDKGAYEYLDRKFLCNIYKSKKQTHGKIDVSEALGVSCNYFFYEIGRRTGIEKISETAEKFGLGELTGIELLGEEAKGKIATPENREKSGGHWYPGDVLQASIGQSDNLFTPLQLANYAGALANGGTNYKVRILKEVRSADGEVIKTEDSEITKLSGASKNALSAVKSGMIKVCTEGGTAHAAFLNFPVTVAGKTGSAQVKDGTNGLFICYAPAENPKIAVSVVLENGDSGANAAAVAREILNEYFKSNNENKNNFAKDKPYTYLP